MGNNDNVIAMDVVVCDPIAMAQEKTVYAGYVYCIRCGLMIFLDESLARVDAIQCPDCGVVNLLGEIYGLRKRGKIVVARVNGDLG